MNIAFGNANTISRSRLEEILQSAKIARSGGDLVKARNEIECILRILPEWLWQVVPDLCYALHYEAALSAFLDGDHARADSWCAAALKRKLNPSDRGAIGCVQARSHLAQGESEQAFQDVRALLSSFSIDIPEQESSIMHWIHRKKLARLTGLARNTQGASFSFDAHADLVAELFTVLLLAAYLAKPQLLPAILLSLHTSLAPMTGAADVIVDRLMRSLAVDQSGHHPADPTQTAGDLPALNATTCPLLQGLYTSAKFASNSCQLHEHELPRFLDSEQMAMIPEVYGLLACRYAENQLLFGESLLVIEEKLKTFAQQLEKTNQTVWLERIRLHQMIIAMLTSSSSPRFVQRQDAEKNSVSSWQHSSNRSGKAQECLTHIHTQWTAKRYRQCGKHVGEFNLVYGTMGLPLQFLLLFASLFIESVSGPDPSASNAIWLRFRMFAGLRALNRWKSVFPEFVEVCSLVLNAQFEKNRGYPDKAAAYYDRAIILAKKANKFGWAAAASELAARMYHSCERFRLCGLYGWDALQMYALWGAEGRMHQMQSLLHESSLDDACLPRQDLRKIIEDVFCIPEHSPSREEEHAAAINLLNEQNLSLVNQVQHLEKLAVFQKISTAIAHEFGNPLLGLRYLLEDLLRRPGVTETDQTLIQLGLGECARLKTLLKVMNSLHRPSQGIRTGVDLHSLIEHVLIVGKKLLTENQVTVRCEFDVTLPAVDVVEDQIILVVFHLIMNAAQSMMGGNGILTITTRRIDDNFVLAVADTGHGIAEEDCQHIFEPFFTTRESEKALGLGLAVSKTIIDSHQGRIEFVSKKEGGSTFTLFLPFRQP